MLLGIFSRSKCLNWGTISRSVSNVSPSTLAKNISRRFGQRFGASIQLNPPFPMCGQPSFNLISNGRWRSNKGDHGPMQRWIFKVFKQGRKVSADGKSATKTGGGSRVQPYEISNSSSWWRGSSSAMTPILALFWSLRPCSWWPRMDRAAWR